MSFFSAFSCCWYEDGAFIRYISLCNKFPQNLEAENYKYLLSHIDSNSQECGCSLEESLWLRASHEVAIKMQGQSFHHLKAWPGWRVHTCMPSYVARVRRPRSSLYMSLYRPTQKYTWLSQRSDLRLQCKEDGSCGVFYNLNLEVPYHHFFYIYWPHKPTLVLCVYVCMCVWGGWVGGTWQGYNPQKAEINRGYSEGLLLQFWVLSLSLCLFKLEVSIIQLNHKR